MTQTAKVRLSLFPVTIHSVHDADTLRVDVDLAAVFPEIASFQPDIRVAHCNAAELKTPEGKAALASVLGWLTDHGRDFTAQVYGRDKYGRLLADLQASSGDLLSAFVLTLDGSAPLSVALAMAPVEIQHDR